MSDRERFLACMLGEKVDRPPYWLFWGPWETTWRMWQEDGLPPGVTEFADIVRSFDPDRPPHIVPVNCGPCPRRERVTLEETEEHVVWVDSWGIRRRNLKRSETMSDFLEWPVKDRDDWKRYRDEWLEPDDPRRLEGQWREKVSDWMAEGIPVQLGYYPDVGIFGSCRWLLGDEECLVSFHTDPGLVHEIMEHMTDIYLAVFERVCRQVRVDVIHLWEDMCGRQGPLISPRHWEEFMGPCYRRIREFATRHDIPVISVDTDGRPDLIVDPMMKAGITYLFPNEVAAGCDVNEYRRRWPDLALMGGIDKRVLTQGPKAIDAELERVRPAMESGRYIPELDHLIPSDVTLDQYRYYAGCLKRLVGKR